MQDGDLAWTAERYLLGELSDADAELFEQTLSESQAAREVLAAAVGLCEAAAAPVPNSYRRRVPMAWIGAAAACIGVAAVAYFSPRSNQLADATPRNKAAVQSSEDWILALPEMIQDQTAMHQAANDDQEIEVEPASSAIADDEELPEWLIFVTAAKESAP